MLLHMRNFPSLVTDIYGSLALLAALQLDVFTPLGDGPLPLADLAARLEIPPPRLRRLLSLLVVEGLLIETAPDVFENSPEAAKLLVKGRPAYRGGAHEAYAAAWSACLKTADSLRSHRPAAPLDFGLDDPEKTAAILRGLGPQAIGGAIDLKRQISLDGVTHLLDIGGGAGGLALTLLAEQPALRATVLETPAIAPVARDLIAPNPDAGRCAVLAGDAVTGPLPPHDLAVMRNFLQLFGGPEILSALAACRAALSPGGRLCIMGYVLDDDRRGPPLALGMDLLFLNYYSDGAAHTRQEYAGWLGACGFTLEAVTPIGGGQTLIVAV